MPTDVHGLVAEPSGAKHKLNNFLSFGCCTVYRCIRASMRQIGCAMHLNKNNFNP